MVALLLYLRTLAPSVGTGDSGELSWVAATLGIAHPPGYPTWTLLAHAFTIVPFGDPAFGANLFSAVTAAAAVGVLALVVGRMVTSFDGDAPQVTPGSTAAVAAVAVSGLGLAVSTGFWRSGLVAEVFALNDLLALLVLLLMLEWARRPDRMRLLWAAAFLSGLALTNQQTIVFTAPGLVILLGLGLERYIDPPSPVTSVARGGRRLQSIRRPFPWRALGIAVAIAFVALLPYVYLPLAAGAGAATVWGDPRSLSGFATIVGRIAYGTFSLTVRDASGSIIEHLGLFGIYVLSAFTPLGVLLALIGWGWLAARRTGEAVALAVWLLMTGPVFLALANPPLDDPVTRGVLERFYVLPSLVVAIALGVGAWRVLAWLEDAMPRIRPHMDSTARRAVAVVAAGVLVLVPSGLAVARTPDVDQSGIRIAADYALDVLGPLPQGTLLLMRGDENYTSVVYAQNVAGVRKDVVALDTELLKLDSYVSMVKARHPEITIPFRAYAGPTTFGIQALIEQSVQARPVYVIGTMAEDLAKHFDIRLEGLATRVLVRGQAPDGLAALRADPGIFDRLHVPGRSYPDTSWEGAIAAHYAELAFRTGLALQQLSPQPNVAQVEHYYRAAIALDPTLASAYKNIGLLLETNAGDPKAIISNWQAYLRLKPDDPEAGAIQASIDRLQSAAP